MLGTLQITSYRAIPSQTKPKDCTWTSIGDRTTVFGCAVSPDLLHSGQVHYGDIVYIDSFGFRVVNDCMGVKAKQSIDLFVRTYDEEKRVGLRHLKVYLISKGK